MSMNSEPQGRSEAENESASHPVETAVPLLDRFDLVYLLRKYIRFLIAVPAACVALAVVYYMFKQPVFESSGLIYIDPKFDRIIQFENGNGGNQSDLDSLKSLEIAMVGSSMVLRVVDKLGLRDEEGFLPAGMTKDGSPPDDKLVGFLQKERFHAGLVADTRLIEISVMDPDAERSRLIADTFTSEFGRFLVEQKQSEAFAARGILEKQAQKARDAAKVAEATLGEFRTAHPDFPVEQDHDLYAQRLTQFSNELNSVVRQRLELESQVEALNDVDAKASPIAVIELAGFQGMAHVSSLLSQRAAADAALASAKQQLVPSDRRYQAAQAAFESNDKQLRDLATEITTAIRSKFKATQSREVGLRAELATLQGGLVGMKALSSEFRGLQQQVDRGWLVHETLQTRLSESVIAEDAYDSIATTVSAPMTPSNKASPSLALLVLVAGFLGSLICGGWIFLRVLRGLPYSDREQLEQRLGLPVIADWGGDKVQPEAAGEPVFLHMLGVRDAKAIQISAPALNGIGKSVATSIAELASMTGAKSLLVVVAPDYPSGAPQCEADGNLVTLKTSPEEAVRPGGLTEILKQAREEFAHIFIEAGGCEDPAVVRWLSTLADKNLIVVGKGGATKHEVDDCVDQLARAEMPPVSLMMIDSDAYDHEDGGAASPTSGAWPWSQRW